MTSTVQQEKSRQVAEILRELDIDLWLVWVRETSQVADPALELVLDADLVWESALMYTKDGTRSAIVGTFDAEGIRPLAVFDEILTYDEGISSILKSKIQKLNPSSIAINYSRNNVAADGLTVGMYEILKDYLRDTPYPNRFISSEDVITRLRGRKTTSELDRIKMAVEITEKIFDYAKKFLRVGISELYIYDIFHQQMEKYDVGNAWSADHNPAVDAGPNKQFGHSGPTENLTKEGHLLHFDFGVKYQGYCSDIQRMFFFGAPSTIPEEITEAFVTVRDAIKAASEFIKPGLKGYEVDALARDYVLERGYDEYKHALGHQIGRKAHDGGTLLGPKWERYGDLPEQVIETGNVFTLELYVTTENYGQVSLEEDILITKTGCQFLSRPQNDLIYIY
ncbi:MAG: M24 family metallopeptidase [Candidatus Lokiarchaeota archaeon]|nr:M24 family metallopeptidase [Candidatus Lokiarchaeota archaeon]